MALERSSWAKALYASAALGLAALRFTNMFNSLFTSISCWTVLKLTCRISEIYWSQSKQQEPTVAGTTATLGSQGLLNAVDNPRPFMTHELLIYLAANHSSSYWSFKALIERTVCHWEKATSLSWSDLCLCWKKDTFFARKHKGTRLQECVQLISEHSWYQLFSNVEV